MAVDLGKLILAGRVMVDITKPNPERLNLASQAVTP
jgi:hypothetical protein